MHWMRMPVQYQDVIQILFAFRPTTEADTNHGLGCAFHFFSGSGPAASFGIQRTPRNIRWNTHLHRGIIMFLFQRRIVCADDLAYSFGRSFLLFAKGLLAVVRIR